LHGDFHDPLATKHPIAGDMQFVSAFKLCFAGTCVILSCPCKVPQDKSGVELVVPSNFHSMNVNNC